MYNTYLNKLVDNNDIPGAVLCISKNGELIFLKSYGSYKNNMNADIVVTTETIFDLASLTKVMVTLPAFLLLYQMKELNLENSVQTYFPQFMYPEITIKHLLQHTSGLPADLKNIARTKDQDVFALIMKSEIINKPGTQVLYSDLGMIILGKIIEKVTNMRIDHFIEKNIHIPWEMYDTQFLPSHNNLDRIAATEFFEGKYIHGVVHDEKAFQLGGISGSAGLFSTAKDVSTFANYWLYPETQSVLSPESMKLVHKGVVENRGLAFELKSDSKNKLSCGRNWPKGSFGHTGFTGTSLWIEPKEKLSVVFLTNVVHFGRNHHLPMIRKKLHTMIYEEEVK